MKPTSVASTFLSLGGSAYVHEIRITIAVLELPANVFTRIGNDNQARQGNGIK